MMPNAENNSSLAPLILRASTAIRSARQTNSAGILGSIAQPMIFRENNSITTAKYNQPVRVRT
jgi:hypothetical protein